MDVSGVMCDIHFYICGYVQGSRVVAYDYSMVEHNVDLIRCYKGITFHDKTSSPSVRNCGRIILTPP